MPRKPRLFLENTPCHVVQRGNNKQACYFGIEDFQFYLECLQDASKSNGCDVHAYVLMTNHVHLLVTPKLSESIGKMMQSIGRRYVRYVNDRYKRTGTLWEGRHKIALVQSESYLLTCYRYIEMNPVRAFMMKHPGEYPWSSFQHNGLGRGNLIVRHHSEYLNLGCDVDERLQVYRRLFLSALCVDDVEAINVALNFGFPLGGERFREQIEKANAVKFVKAKPGRPRKMGVGVLTSG